MYECQSKREHQAKWDTGLNGRQAKYEHQASIGVRQTWAPGRHGRRSKREHRSKRWLVSARLWASLLSGRLVEPHEFRLLGGVPEPHLWNCYRKLESGPPHLLLFRRQKAVRRLTSSASGVPLVPLLFLRQLSHLFKVRPIRFSHGTFYRTFKCNQVASLARRFRRHSVCAGYAVSQGCSDVAEIVQGKFISSNAPSSAGGRCLIGKNKKSIQAVSQQYLETSR